MTKEELLKKIVDAKARRKGFKQMLENENLYRLSLIRSIAAEDLSIKDWQRQIKELDKNNP